ncbi:MAG: LacI family DNA-binding transcriptional regulator, partial [Victivallales bacterium]
MVTINDIAKHTGLSRSTVAAVLSGRAEALKISVSTRETVRKAAGKLNYHRNSLAYQMATGTTNVIGFLCEDLGAAEFTGAILSGIMREAADSGYYAKIFPYVRGDAGKTLAGIIGQRPAGVIAFSVIPPDFEPIFDGLAKAGIPLLSLNDVRTDRGLFVVTDDADGVSAVVDHLHSLGHRKIGFFTTRKSVALKGPRSEGFLRSVTKHGLSESVIIPELLDNPDL